MAWGDADGHDCGRRVVRGGSWDVSADWCRSACRDNWVPGNRNDNVGVRVVLPLPPDR